MSQTVKMPRVEFVWREKYDLSELDRELMLPTFQRKRDNDHVTRIASAIMENRFYDNVILVYKENDKMFIIDGQHRIAALKTCYAKYKLKEYNLMFCVFPKEAAPLVFRRNNLGKKVTIPDMLHSMGDVNPQLFSRMKKYVDSYRNQYRLGYGDLFAAFIYAVGGKKESGVNLLEHFLPQVETKHIDAMEKMMAILYQLEKNVNKNPIYRAPSFRNIYKLTLDLGLDERKIGKLVAYIRSSNELLKITEDRKHDAIIEFYQKIIAQKGKWMQ